MREVSHYTAHTNKDKRSIMGQAIKIINRADEILIGDMECEYHTKGWKTQR